MPKAKSSRNAPVPAITAQRLAEVARQFTGAMRQMPPMHSALKKDGKALYEYARAGEEVEREARDVVIWTLELGLGEAPDTLKLLAKVSKGTYIRTLGEDIGEALGCGGHLTSLRRIATGHFDLSGCITLDAPGSIERSRNGCPASSPSIPCCPTTRPSHWTRTMQADS